MPVTRFWFRFPFGPRSAVLLLAARCLLGAGLALGTTSAPAADPPGSTATLEVSAFEVTGNTLLPFLDIQRTLEPFKGRRSAAELQAAADRLQALYAEAGWGGVVVFLPPQDAARRARGVIALTVLEGKVGRILVRGQEQFSEANVRASLPELTPGRTPHLPRLDAQLQLANENAAKHLRVLLKPGERPGETDAEVSVNDIPYQRVTLLADNSGNARTGHWRVGLGWQHANLSDADDTLALQYQTSPTHTSRVDVRSLAYRRPFYGPRLLLDAFAARSDIDGGSVATALGDIRFNGTGQIAGLRLGHLLPRLGGADQRIALGLDWRKYLNRCEIAGLPTGACGTAAGRVVVLPLSLDYSLQSPAPNALGGSLSLQTNTRRSGRDSDLAAFQAVRADAKPGYSLLRLGLNGEWRPAPAWGLRGRLASQLTRAALIPGEQFGLGGAGSVRGYRERELAGDQGSAASLELVQTLWPNEAATDASAPPSLLLTGLRAQWLAFIDTGRVSNRYGTPCLDGRSACSALSWGLGLRLGWGGWQLTLDVARAERAAAETERGDWRGHLAASYSH
jgi:hemolysin activation/secretion protein